MDEQALEIAAKAIWESEPHHLLAAGGHPVKWEEQCSSIKRSVTRQARLAIRAYQKATGANNE